jgi:transglutaminase-like putative cysteine protease
MRIINSNVKSKIINTQLILLFHFCLFALLAGCSKAQDLKQAQDEVQQSEVYYQRAVDTYKNLITKSKDSDRLYFELGRVYYGHGDFKQAKEAFKNSNTLEAKKFLAISNYCMGNFTDALEAFGKLDIQDDEYLYYYGLTCEKLNLFDKALQAYKKVKGDKFKVMALARKDIIEKQSNLANIKDTDPRILKIIANAPAQEQYPQAGALILFAEESSQINLDGTEVTSLHYLIKILNDRGKEEFSESHTDYDSTFEKVELEFARTINPDGTIAEVGTRHIRDVSKYLNFPLYSNARVYIISFPEITEGAVIEYKLKIHNNELINKKDFVSANPIQTSEPILAADYSISVPKERQLHLKFINEKFNDFGASLNPVIEEKDNRFIYRWQFKDIPQIIPESNMPPEVQINPTILASTFNSWLDIYNWWWALAKDKIKADDAIKEKVKELASDKISEEDKVRAIYNFCAQNIRYVAVEYGQAGYEPHQASDIFKNKYGDCKDKAILLVTMLRAAGIKCWPLLIATKDYYNLNEDFPAVLFNHSIAAVNLNDKVIFLDATAQTCPFGDLPSVDQKREVLIIQEDTFKIQETPAYPAGHNRTEQYLKLKINKDETVTAQKSISTYGAYDQAQRYWLLYTQPELIQETIKEKIQDISIGAKLNRYNIENLDDLDKPIVLSYDFQGPEYLTLAGNLRIMPQLAGLDTTLVAKDKRKYAIDFGLLDIKETISEIEIPDNFFIKYMPHSLTEDSPWLKVVIEYNQKDHNLSFVQRTELKQKEIPEGEYPDFKKFFENLAQKIKQRIVLERLR